MPFFIHWNLIKLSEKKQIKMDHITRAQEVDYSEYTPEYEQPVNAYEEPEQGGGWNSQYSRLMANISGWFFC
jgi:hypothetical protein